LALGDQARQAGGQLGAQGDQVAAAVRENKGLLFDQLFAGLGGVQVDGFQEGRIPFLVAEGFRHLASSGVKEVAHGHFFGVEVTGAFDGGDSRFHSLQDFSVHRLGPGAFIGKRSMIIHFAA
jgi:hypothetical protein